MVKDLPESDDQNVEEPEEEAPVKTSYHSLKDEDPLDEEKTEEEPEEPEEHKESEKTEDRPEHKFKHELIGQPEIDNQDQYYLQAVRTGEAPEWSRPKEDLDVFSQPLDGGLIQYWAYLKDAGKTADSVPHAEEMARSNKSDNPAIIIDQICDHLTPGSCLELVLAKGGHALAKTESNLDNLESNITSLLDLAKQNFGITAEHFMSTGNVSPEVEKRLDDLEETEAGEKEDMPANKPDDFRPAVDYNQGQEETKMEKKRPKIVILLPIFILIVIFIAVVFYRDQLFSKVMNKINPPKPVPVEVTPIPTPTPTPTPTVDRSQFKVRVLNGTPATGAAGTLAEKLKALGWQIDRTGNATSSAIAESYIRMKTGTAGDTVQVLISDVSDYSAASSSSDLKSNDKADLEFVIGKK